jgi:hypothetical protein
VVEAGLLLQEPPAAQLQQVWLQGGPRWPLAAPLLGVLLLLLLWGGPYRVAAASQQLPWPKGRLLLRGRPRGVVLLPGVQPPPPPPLPTCCRWALPQASALLVLMWVLLLWRAHSPKTCRPRRLLLLPLRLLLLRLPPWPSRLQAASAG